MVEQETEKTHGKIGLKIIQQRDGWFISKIGREKGRFLFQCGMNDTSLRNVEEYAKDLCRHLDIEYFGVQYLKPDERRW
jgi:hypothetical protein